LIHADAPITIKTANISLLHRFHDRLYVVNLVDTPGHVDFSGKVTRSLRVIDGAVVVVDAVEGVMAQTENVLRAAVGDRVRPVLFINKVDRLIRELKLSPKQIQDKLTAIIQRVNGIIAQSATASDLTSWQVNPESDTVAFGSALHIWGFTISQMNRQNLRFRDILTFYEKDQVSQLGQRLPITEPILEMILRKLPSPRQAQTYRIQHIWKGRTDSPAGLALVKCESDGPLIGLVSSLVEDSRYGQVAVARVFSGTVRQGTMVRILPADIKSTIQRVSLFMGSRRAVVPAVVAGNICGLAGLEGVKAGDTIIGQLSPSGMVPFDEIRYVNEPVVTVSIEPKLPRELPRLLSYLDTLTRTDPNLSVRADKETGEYLLSGIGLLHLEITIHDVEKAGIPVIASEPIVLYRETPRGAAALRNQHFSPNGKNALRLAVGSTHGPTSEAKGAAEETWFYDERGNRLTSGVPTKNVAKTAQEALVSGFAWACERGPLCGEPLGATVANLVEVGLSSDLQDQSRVELMSMMKEALFEALAHSGMTLLEPIYQIQVLVPNDCLRDVSRVILSKRGRVEHVEQKGPLVDVKGVIPVAETFDLATVLRSQTSGRAVWQTRFADWRPVPDNRLENIASTIKKRKGWRGT
jgi:elongation factor 2